MMQHDGLALSNICIDYGRHAVIRGLSMPALARGTLTALIGPNAAGKSTLLRGVAGLGPMSGQVLLHGQDLARLPRAERARRVTYMPQTLPPGVALNVVETVISALHASPIEGQSVTRKGYVDLAYDALDRIGIGHLALRSLSELSGGQRQLASLAQAIARRPEVLLLDEPTSALDLRYQMLVMSSVQGLVREHDLVGMVVLHDIGLAARYADTVAVLHSGRIAALGAPADAITSELLAEVYGVRARVAQCTRGTVQVIVDDALPMAQPVSSG
jgi:iron complex transport system ATP-binding protein